jgi:hypothetical protein
MAPTLIAWVSSSKPASPPCARIRAAPRTDRWRPTHDCADQDYDEGLSRQARDHPGEHGRGCRSDDGWIHLHADGDEKQAQQDIAKGPDVILYLMTEIAFADHHPGEERTDRCGKSGQMSGKCRAERQQQNGKQQKEIGRVRSGNPGEPGAKNRLAHESSDAECGRRYSELA